MEIYFANIKTYAFLMCNNIVCVKYIGINDKHTIIYVHRILFMNVKMYAYVR